MNNVTPAAPENFAAELVRRGLPVDYSERVARELADHWRDVVDELRATGLDESESRMEAGRRLGDERALVKKTAREFQRRHWCGRRPLITFLFGPVALLAASFMVIVLLSYVIMMALEQMGLRFDQRAPDGIISTGEFVAAMIGRVVVLFVAPAVSLLILARYAQRAAMDSRWLVLSTCVLTAVVSSIWLGLAGDVRPNFPADQGLTILGPPLLRFFARDPMYVAQCLLPVGIGVGMILRMRGQWRNNERLILEVAQQGGSHEYAKCA